MSAQRPFLPPRHLSRPASPANLPVDLNEAALQRYIQQLRLEEIDLSDVQLELETPSRDWSQLWQDARLALLGLTASLWVVLTSSNFYLMYPQWSFMTPLLGSSALGLGWSLRALLQQRATEAWQAWQVWQPPTWWRVGNAWLRRQLARWHLPVLPAPVWRALLLLCVLGLGSGVYFLLPREAQWQGSGYSTSWFAAVLLALTTGILAGRWLMLQGEHATKLPPRPSVKAWVAPPWFKWVSLSLLICGGLYAVWGHQLWGLETDTSSFSSAGVGFAVGIFAAIWLARRFDELAQPKAKRLQD